MGIIKKKRRLVKKVKVVVDRDPVFTSFEKFRKPGHFSKALLKGGPVSTTWVWNLHAEAHDFDRHSSDLQEISRKVFSAHFGQIGIILIWLSGIFFHGARFSNYESWISDPIHVKPSAQIVWPIVGQEILNMDVGGGFQGIQITSGFFPIWRGAGITSELQIYCCSIGSIILSATFFFAGWFHYHKSAPRLRWFQNVESMLNHHLSGIFGLGSLSWRGHQIHIAGPVNRLLDGGVDPKDIPLPHEWLSNRDLIAEIFPSFNRGLLPFFQLQWGDYKDVLTFRGGINPYTGGLWMSDISHHHLAIAVIFIFAGHIYNTGLGVGHNLLEIMERHKGPFTGEGHRGIFDILTTSWHAQLAINLAMMGSLSIIVAHHIYAIPPYPFLSIDYPSVLSLFTHHMWIGAFCIVGAAAHASIFLVRDYDPSNNYNNVLDRVIRHRDSIISHLNWVCIFLGLHSFGLYIHNDTMSALGRPRDMFSDSAIQLNPIFAKWVQNAHSAAPGWSNPKETAAGVSDFFSLAGKVTVRKIPLGTADFIVHHIHAFTIHVTVLILLKGVLYSRSSRLIPGKSSLGFRFPCDGPGRGGTCQVSAWDHVFLGLFWMYNCISVVIFHFSWKIQSDVWGTLSTTSGVSHITGGNFSQSANTINGWLRDFLWAQSSQVIQSYGSAISAYGLVFLGAHFIWAFSLIFLFSGRGYWQELIESIIWAHNKVGVSPSVQPRALSITQGRAVGVAHYLLGGIATTWSFFLARIISVG